MGPLIRYVIENCFRSGTFVLQKNPCLGGSTNFRGADYSWGQLKILGAGVEPLRTVRVYQYISVSAYQQIKPFIAILNLNLYSILFFPGNFEVSL